MKRPAIALVPAMLLVACSTPLPPAPTPVAQAAAPAAHAAAPPRAPVANVAPVSKTETPIEAFERLQPGLDRDSIYFDYDKYAIKQDEDSMIQRHARVLVAYPRDRITVQGNCDERGGREYNLALGQRRADAVKERLELLGVASARIDTVSFGKEKPRETCHQERCWAENRRDDFVDTWQ